MTASPPVFLMYGLHHASVHAWVDVEVHSSACSAKLAEHGPCYWISCTDAGCHESSSGSPAASSSCTLSPGGAIRVVSA
jgi:hypothetical protein